MNIKEFFSSLCNNNKTENNKTENKEGKENIKKPLKNMNTLVEYSKNISNKEINTKEVELEALNRISTLPEILVSIIQEYIPDKVMVFIDKTFYLSNHHIIMKMLNKNQNTEKYIRYIIRRDFSYVFSLMLHENIVNWVRYRKKYPYNTVIYTSYIYFLLDYCIEHESNKCKEEIISLLEKIGLWKKDNKKIKTTSIRRWRK